MSTSMEFDAISFDHEESLVDFVRQYGRSERQGTYALYACTPARASKDSDGTERTLFLVRQDRALPTNPSYAPVKIQVEGDVGAQTLRTHGRARRTYKVASRRVADRLPALLGPVPVDTPEVPPNLVFWIRDEATFQDVVTLSMRLGCDRLQATAIDGRNVRGQSGPVVDGRVLLLRAERPSFFVIDVALAREGVEVYVPLSGGTLYVPWGTTHPLAELWTHKDDTAVFLRGLGTAAEMSVVSLPAWGDIYGLTRFSLEGLEGDQQWEAGKTPLRRFEVRLRLVPSHKARETHLWMMPASQQPHLERLLHMIPEADLDALMFAIQEDPDGDRHILIRERHTGVGRQYIDFEGREFAPYAGYPNLMLPIEEELEPKLRKDRYREIFALRTGELTLMWQDGGRPRLVRVEEKGFRPLTELVDYIVGTGTKALEDMIRRTVFDFPRFESAPRRPAERLTDPQRQRNRRQRAQEEAEEDLEDAIEYEAEAADEGKQAKGRKAAKLVYPEQNEEAKAKALDALQKREIDLEEAIIVEGQSVERWTTLAGVKRELGKAGEEALCWQEALWLAFEEQREDAEALDKAVLEALERRPDINVAKLTPAQRFARAQEQVQVADNGPDWLWLHISYGATQALDRNSGALRQWLSESYKLLQAQRSSQRTKVRWLLWGKLLEINQDGTQEVKLREALLEQLTSRGLQSFEAPTFIRNRVYQSRFIQEQDTEAEGELEAATVILEALQSELDRAQDLALSRISASILAYAYERLGNRGQSEHFFQQAENFLQSPTGLTPIERAWMTLYLGATADLRVAGTGRPWVDRYNDLLRQPSTQGLARSELDVIQKSIFRRTQADNPTEFFSPENFRTFFSTAGNYDAARQIRDQLERHIQRGKFAAALRDLKDLANRAAAGRLELDERPFAWLLGPIVNILRRIGQASEGIGILHKLEASVGNMPRRTRIPLYSKLFRLKLGEGFLELGEEEHGTRIITEVIRETWQNRDLVWLDHLDMLGAGLEAVEASPLHQRPQAVREVLSALFITNKHPQDSEQYRPVKLRLIDHCVEVALSKEKLSLRRYKSYLDEDEFHVRYRIVNEPLAEGS